jgi:predicted O-methyltransferase YrrM
VVELGVYEGSSATVLCSAMSADAELHLVDPFVDRSGWALRPGARANPVATRLALRRANRRGGPTLRWHLAASQDVGRAWDGGPVDLLFVDGDHSPDGCRQDFELWHGHIARDGLIAFHDARASQAGGSGSPGPTMVVDELIRDSGSEWTIADEVDSLVVVRREIRPLRVRREWPAA